jgi:hypothetical protein
MKAQTWKTFAGYNFETLLMFTVDCCWVPATTVGSTVPASPVVANEIPSLPQLPDSTHRYLLAALLPSGVQ